MASLLSSFNKLLPFATPGTPLLQDLVHLAAICLFLYFAPQLQDWGRRRKAPTEGATTTTETANAEIEVPQEAAEAEVAVDEVNAEAVIPEPVHDAQAVEPQPAIDTGINADENDSDSDDGQPDHANDRAGGPSDRNVGAKKAKSLARKDQRRAYHEFMRSQGEAQRARDAEGAEEREAALEAEKKRRALAEAELAAKRAKDREAKKEAEQAERDAEIQRRETAVAIVKADLLARNISDLHRVAIQVGGDVDIEWVEKVIIASGIIGRKESTLTMITSTGWAAKITETDARAFYAQAAVADYADEHGWMEGAKLSETLTSVLSSSAVAANA